jgi:hypothetical protein
LFLVFGRFGGQHQNRCELEGRHLSEFLDQGDSVHLRHVEVRDDDVHLGSGRHFLDRIHSVLSFHDLKSGMGKCERHHLPHGG